MKKINITGTIIDNSDQDYYQWHNLDYYCPEKLHQELEGLTNEPLQVTINSGGGSVFAGSEIFSTLKVYPGKVEVVITGLCASIASIIAMAGDVISMSPAALLMIHNVSSVGAGDYRDFQDHSEILDNMSEMLAIVYHNRTGLKEEELRQMMDKETWLRADQALELGFIDKVLENAPLQLVANTAGVVPLTVIEKWREQMGKQATSSAPKNDGFAKFFGIQKKENNKPKGFGAFFR